MKDSARYVLNGLAHAGVGEVLFDTFENCSNHTGMPPLTGEW